MMLILESVKLKIPWSKMQMKFFCSPACFLRGSAKVFALQSENFVSFHRSSWNENEKEVETLFSIWNDDELLKIETLKFPSDSDMMTLKIFFSCVVQLFSLQFNFPLRMTEHTQTHTWHERIMILCNFLQTLKNYEWKFS